MKKFFAFMAFICFLACLVSCNVTRRVTTESSFIQKGDTSVTITVKTVETYDAKKNPNL